MTQSIAFIGDSFANSYGQARHDELGQPKFQRGTDSPTYTQIVADHFGWTIEPFGFGGKSWWYSRCEFLKALERFEQQLTVAVFCHTNPQRINNAWNKDLELTNYEEGIYADYYRYIYDDDFNSWAQQAWFKEIKERWNNIKTIHFHCFTDTIPYGHLLPGMVFNQPLMHVSIGELQGNDQEVHKQTIVDPRCNHLSDANNQQLARLIIHSIEHYEPGQHILDLSQFNPINPNAHRFPNPGFGTK